MGASDCVALESILAAAFPDGCFKLVSASPVSAAAALTLPDFTAGVTFFLEAFCAADAKTAFDAALTAGFIPCLTAAVVDSAIALPDLARGLAAVAVPGGVVAVLAASLSALFDAPFLGADLVTVAFIASSLPMNCLICRSFT
jgi:hypothetical protein